MGWVVSPDVAIAIAPSAVCLAYNSLRCNDTMVVGITLGSRILVRGRLLTQK